MVSPFEIMPVLAMAVFIAFIPLLSDAPPPARVKRAPRERVITVPHVGRRPRRD